MEEELKAAGYHPADTNGDGNVTSEEHAMYMEFKRKELEDKDAQRDAIRIAPTYFASIAVLVSAFFGADAMKK